MHVAHDVSVRTIFMSVLAVCLLATADYLTGAQLGFFVFYFIPISATAWHAGKRPAVAMAFLSAIAWFLADLPGMLTEMTLAVRVWNTAIRLAAFVMMAIAISVNGQLMREEQELTIKLRAAIDQVRQLRGLLPICSSCKRIRDDQGYWEQIETYIHDHSDASFTHGICPDCIRKLYPDIADDLLRDESSTKAATPSTATAPAS